MSPLKSSNTKRYSNRTSSPPPPPSNTIITENRPGIMNTMISTAANGFAFGAGNTIARNIIDPFFSSSKKKEDKPKCHLCDEYLECLKNNKEEICNQFDLCKQYDNIK